MSQQLPNTDPGVLAPTPRSIRERAEASFLDHDAPAPGGQGEQSPQAMLHELRVHQIELEIQNEELRRTSVALDASRTRYFSLYDLAPMALCSISNKGLIQESNLTAARLLGISRADLIGQALSNFVVPADQSDYYRWRRLVQEGDRPSPCELLMLTALAEPFWAMLDASKTHLQDDEPVVQIVLSDVSARKSAELALQEAQQRLNNFALRQQEDFEELRMEVAHEVHDQLGQILAALKLETDLLRELAPLAAARMHALVQTGVTSVRDISRALRPAALELGLIHALRVMVAEMSARAGILIDSFMPERLPPLSGKVERGLCRIAQEALTNAMLHSQASRIQISLEASADGLVLEIHDNGSGFEITSPSVTRGLGLLGMRERARQLGAQLTLQTRPEQGTRIHLRWPLTSA